MSTHYYSGKTANKKHNEIVEEISNIFRKSQHEIVHPDAQNSTENSKIPDIIINNELAVEVKILNPTINDFNIDKEAEKKWVTSKFTDYGGEMNPGPIQRDVEKASQQLIGVDVNYKLLVLYSPLTWQLKHDRLADMLRGLRTIDLFSRNGEIIATRTRRTQVPIKQGVEQKINGIFYINESHFESRILWKLNEKDNELLHLLDTKIVNFWEEGE